jgi:hypothetical protein
MHLVWRRRDQSRHLRTVHELPRGRVRAAMHVEDTPGAGPATHVGGRGLQHRHLPADASSRFLPSRRTKCAIYLENHRDRAATRKEMSK